MPSLFVFLFKVNAALLLFCLGYYFVLRHLTYYTLNRIYLVSAILFSTLYPKINLSGFFEHHRVLSGPVQTAILKWKTPAVNFIKPLYQPDYWYWAELIFWTGAALLTLRLAMQLISLFRLYKGSRPGKVNDHSVRLIDGETTPFSFWQSIFINPDSLDPSDLKGILQHEQIHVNDWHTLDILLAELSTIFYWFNPGVWLIKKAVRENIEFITDRKILQRGVDSKQYQYSLVHVSFAAKPNAIVNHFNISTIKKRIIMMNSKRSSKFTLTRYALLVPGVIALLLVFSFSKADITKTTIHTIKGIALNVSKIHLSNLSAVAPSKHNMLITPIKRPKHADTIYKVKGKSNSFLVTSSHSKDSTIYLINGIKSTKADMDALNPDKIESLDVLSGEDAKPFYADADNSHQVLFITTNDSEAGKRLKAKMDEAMAGNSIHGRGTKNIQKTLYLTTSDNAAGSGSSSNNFRVTTDDDNIVGSGNVDKVVIAGAEPKTIHTTRLYKKNFVVSSDAKTLVTVNGFKSVNDDVRIVNINKDPQVFTWDNKVDSRIKIKSFSNTGIDHISDKLIIIDGKEATEKDMKKLKAYDIESLNIKDDQKTKATYGEKAKNGVLYITTKK